MFSRALRSYSVRCFSTARTFRFAPSHEWVKQESQNIYSIGISKHARDNLGEVVYASQPEVGQTVSIGESFLDLESIKAVASVYSPVDGVIVEVNDLGAGFEKLNEAPQGEGWLVKVEASKFSEELLSDEAYNTQYPDNQ